MAALNEIRDLRRQFAGLLQSAGLFAHRDRTSSLVGGAYHNRHRTNRHLVSAVVSAGCYPHLAVLKSGNADGRSSAGKLEWHCARRGTKSQALTRVHVAPESVNHNARTATYPFLVFFEKRIHGASVSASASAGGHARPAAGQGGNSGRTMLMGTSVLSPFAIIMFGNNGNLQVKHRDHQVVVDGWLKLNVSPKTAVLLRELRREVDRILTSLVENPAAQTQSENEQVVDSIAKMLLQEGQAGGAAAAAPSGSAQQA